jgi:hypothetical protein
VLADECVGIERREPARDRDEIKRRIARLKGEFTRNAGLRFRIQTLNARYLSYDRMWARSAREKEEGTYRRDVLRARRHLRQKPGRPKAAGAGPAGEAAPAAAAGPPTTGAAPPAAGMLPEPQLRALYDALVEAKTRCNEDLSRVSYEALARSVEKQIPELKARFNAKSIEFKVVIKDGRAVVKAVPRT